MNPNRRYEVVVAGHECANVAERLGGLDVVHVNGHTAIRGERLDAAMLAGVLRELDRLGLELRSVSSRVVGS